MLSVNVTISGDRVIINGLNQLAAEMPKVVQRGLKKVARGTYRIAMDKINGAGGFNSYETRTSSSGKQYQKKTGSKLNRYVGFTRSDGAQAMFKSFTDSGGYPVPVRTGNLKRLLDWLDPGETKGVFSAGQMEVVVYDSALYASVIHQGTGSSAKFGPRPFMTDALNKFNQGNGISGILNTEISAEIARRGLT